VLFCSIFEGCERLTEQIYKPVIDELNESIKDSKDKGVSEVLEIMRDWLIEMRKISGSGKLQ